MAHTIIVLDTDGATPLFTHITSPTEAEASKKARRVLRKHGMTVKHFTQVDVTAFMTQLSPDDTTEQWVKQTEAEILAEMYAPEAKLINTQPDPGLAKRAAEYEAEAAKVSIFPTHNLADPYEGALG